MKLNIIYKCIALVGMILMYQSVYAQTETIEITVHGNCGMCKDRIENAALSTSGVESAIWDSSDESLKVEVNQESFSVDELQLNIALEGQDTDLYTAPDEVYTELPDCCLYRDEVTKDMDHSMIMADNPVVRGTIFEQNKKGKNVPLIGANIFWVGANGGTVTDAKGRFEIDRIESTSDLVISYIGYGNDTLDMSLQNAVEVIMTNAVYLNEVNVTYRQKSTSISFLDPVKIQSINQQELQKAACCNLSESFETNPSVDVSFTDAVTGTRQIQMLGLAGPYVQITRENVPEIRGLAALYGFTYTPGSWIEGIQLNLGTGSVLNGFESMAGQINIELKKPEASERFFLNIYGNEGGRFEVNANSSHQVSEKLSTAFLVHGKISSVERDRNSDGFMDMPIANNLIVMNRWKLDNQKGIRGQLGIKGTFIDNNSGQLGSIKNNGAERLWGGSQSTNRLEGWLKLGKVYDKVGKSIGAQFSGFHHDQNALFGDRVYDAQQSSFYTNLIYQDIISNTFHSFKTGLSFQWDKYEEHVDQIIYERNEMVPGAYFEYTYNDVEKLTAVAGIRADYHNNYGLFFTPRLHLRFVPFESSVLRASIGRGLRTASIFAENIGVFASSRDIFVHSENLKNPYGLNPEVAWNYGFNISQEITLADRALVMGVDLYHTRFENQIVVDYLQSARALHFYNLDGESYSNSVQFQLDYELIPRLDIRVAYRFNDVKTTFATEGLIQKPLYSKQRAFVNLGYTTESDWGFDFTLNWQDNKTIPSTSENPVQYQRPEVSPAYFLSNAQISKSWKDEKLEIYLGGENIFNFKQENPIISVEDPFSEYFDSSLVWGPVFGRNIYVGLRYKLD